MAAMETEMAEAVVETKETIITGVETTTTEEETTRVENLPLAKAVASVVVATECEA